MIYEHEYAGCDSNPARIASCETLLRSEIAFWRDMIDSCDADHPPESLERMRQAQGLAEFRLLELYRAIG